MPRSIANASERGSSQLNTLDGTSTRRTRRSGHTGISRKDGEIILRLLKELQDAVRRSGENFRSSIRGLSEELSGRTRSVTEIAGGLNKTNGPGEPSQSTKRVRRSTKRVRQSTKRVLGNMPDSFAGIKADTAEPRKDSAELRVESKETRRRVKLLQGDIERTHTCVSEIASTAMAPSVTAAAQAATQAPVKAGEEGEDSV
ncbi:hypothetical protein V8D89_003410 [Ganoderma adspersum]